MCEFVVSFLGTNAEGKEKEKGKGRRRLGKTPELVFAARRVGSTQVESLSHAPQKHLDDVMLPSWAHPALVTMQLFQVAYPPPPSGSSLGT